MENNLYQLNNEANMYKSEINIVLVENVTGIKKNQLINKENIMMNNFKNKLILQIHLKIMRLLMYQNNNEIIELYRLNSFIILINKYKNHFNIIYYYITQYNELIQLFIKYRF